MSDLNVSFNDSILYGPPPVLERSDSLRHYMHNYSNGDLISGGNPGGVGVEKFPFSQGGASCAPLSLQGTASVFPAKKEEKSSAIDYFLPRKVLNNNSFFTPSHMMRTSSLSGPPGTDGRPPLLRIPGFRRPPEDTDL